MISKIIIGRGLSGADRYVSQKQGSAFVSSNMAGRDARQRALEFAALRSARPGLSKAAGHLILAHARDGRALTVMEWEAAVEEARKAHDFRDAAFLAFRHPPDRDHDHDHVHVVFCRVRPDGSVVSDSQSFRKNEDASRQIERALGLPPPTPSPSNRRPGNRKAVDAARRRSSRKKEPLMNIPLIRDQLVASIAVASNVPDLERQAALNGLKLKFNRRGTEIFGWAVALDATDTYVSASSIGRDLAWGKVSGRLEANAQARLSPARTPGLAERPAARPGNVAQSPAQVGRMTDAASPAPRVQDEFDRELAALSRHDLEQLARMLDDLTPDEKEASRQRLIELLERLICLMIKIITLGRVDLGPSGGISTDEAARRHTAGAVDAELDRRAEAGPRTCPDIDRARGVIDASLRRARSNLSAAPKNAEQITARARATAAMQISLGALEEAYEGAQRGLSSLQSRAPVGVRARLSGAVARHAAAMEEAKRQLIDAHASVNEGRALAARIALAAVPEMEAEVERLRTEVLHLQRLAERLERERLAAVRLHSIEPDQEAIIDDACDASDHRAEAAGAGRWRE